MRGCFYVYAIRVDATGGFDRTPTLSPRSVWYIIPMPTDPNCIFCKICSKEAPAEIVYEDPDYVCFVDRKPASTHHYLVTPRRHIQDSRSLTASHIPMVERMAEIGRQMLEERGESVDKARFGFHWPPFVLVKHLHLHVISPESGMGWLNRTVIFRKDSYFFNSPNSMINYIKSK